MDYERNYAANQAQQKSYDSSLVNSGYGLAAASTGADVESASRIRDGVSQAEQLLSSMHETISMLEKRLDTVLQPVPPQPAEPGGLGPAKNQMVSHLYGRIAILNEGYEHAMVRLRNLARRVEI